jgi:hypothetical protein
MGANNLRIKCRCISAYSITTTLSLLFWHAYHLFLCTYWVPIISALILAIFPATQNLLLRSWRRCGIFWWGVLGLRCPGSIFLWIMEHSTVFLSWELFSILKDNIHVIIIFYLWHLALPWTLMSICVKLLFLGTHAMSIHFWSQNRVWHPHPSWVGWHLVVRVLPIGTNQERCVKPPGPDLYQGASAPV